MIQYTVTTSKRELEQILMLQQKNLPITISEEEKKLEGFVTVEHDFHLIKRMNDVCAHILAKDEEDVIGYALCMHPDFSDEIAVLRPMFKQIATSIAHSSLSLKEELSNYIVMGQVCVAKEYRGQGIFRALYEKMKEVIIPTFNTIITEVDSTNVRSLNAHYAIGFKKLSNYTSDGRDWELIYLT